MGKNYYGSKNDAQVNKQLELDTVRNLFPIKQEFTIVYAILFYTSDSFNNDAKAYIEHIETVN